MSYSFTNRRRPKSSKELTATECEQLVKAWEYYSGDVEDAERLVSENPEWFELWSVEHDERPEFDYWHLPPDSGTLFYAGEAVPTGIRVIQFGWDVVEDLASRSGADMEALAEKLDEAWRVRRES